MLLFTSYIFFVTCLSTLALYQAAPSRWRPYVLLVISYYFYSYATFSHLGILLFDTMVAYLCGRLLSKSHRAFLCGVGVILILTPLIVFKYVSLFFPLGPPPSSSTTFAGGFAILPIGISFYSLQAISYIVDVYRRRSPPIIHPITCALYLAFFPQILAGPIERSSHLTPQLTHLPALRRSNLYVGLKIALWGYFCKLILADRAAMFVSHLLDGASGASVSTIVCALHIYSLQIYFDFLGYTMIAIGIARLFGIQLSTNFDRPYLSTSIRAFWRRWHITLMSWFRDYVYVPMGGRQRGPFRFSLAILCVFTLSGLWLGASLNFLAWGVLHGIVFLLSELGVYAVSRSRPSFAPAPGVAFISSLATFTFVSLSWSLFIANSYPVLELTRDALSHGAWMSFPSVSRLSPQETLVSAGLLAGFFLSDSLGVVTRVINTTPHTRVEIGRELAFVNVMLSAILLFAGSSTDAFIYFRF